MFEIVLFTAFTKDFWRSGIFGRPGIFGGYRDFWRLGVFGVFVKNGQNGQKWKKSTACSQSDDSKQQKKAKLMAKF